LSNTSDKQTKQVTQSDLSRLTQQYRYTIEVHELEDMPGYFATEARSETVRYGADPDQALHAYVMAVTGACGEAERPTEGGAGR
jgi:hypothetical protein